MLSISYCGRVGSFSYEAALAIFPQGRYLPYNTFAEAITAVEKGSSQYAVIPIENSTAGRVAEIHNLLPSLNLKIVKEKIIPISHNLYVLSKEISENDIKLVESHPQALMQCSKYLAKLNIEKREALNTAIAAENLAKDRIISKGVICSKVAGELYKLCLLRENIQDSNDNHTAFIAVGRESMQEDFQRPLTSILFTIANKKGGIYEALGCFAKNGVNLLKLESYIPTGLASQVAQFFLTFEGSSRQENIGKALGELSAITNEIKNLGTYEGDAKRFF